MIRPGDMALAAQLRQLLLDFSRDEIPLHGISSVAERECFINQIVDSDRRIRWVTTIRDKQLSSVVADPRSNSFDPIKAASWHRQQGNFDEACWLTFISVHFGKHGRSKWNLAKNVYGKLGQEGNWDWQAVSTDPGHFRLWLAQNQANLRVTGSFGNHRKYTSLKDHETGRAFSSYVSWVGAVRGHAGMLNDAIVEVGNDPRVLYNHLYRKASAIHRFGRMAKFDYLCMLGKLGLAQIEPDKTYMSGATGPYTGAMKLFGGHLSRHTLENHLIRLEQSLTLGFGMQVLEDAICNWQKSPASYKYFGG